MEGVGAAVVAQGAPPSSWRFPLPPRASRLPLSSPRRSYAPLRRFSSSAANHPPSTSHASPPLTRYSSVHPSLLPQPKQLEPTHILCPTPTPTSEQVVDDLKKISRNDALQLLNSLLHRLDPLAEQLPTFEEVQSGPATLRLCMRLRNANLQVNSNIKKMPKKRGNFFSNCSFSGGNFFWGVEKSLPSADIIYSSCLVFASPPTAPPRRRGPRPRPATTSSYNLRSRDPSRPPISPSGQRLG
ncbi:hypothetical protein GUJ93_ZPchr0006g44210 [Zizania palustris]|uniref:Uncharacterized protein n=1 Tax=Zizania palustris TaxID=103762 RepID=A0A8J5SUF0_ZIZPA|nr:hypothetical protein GUJ93_ZPchr0006g44210 [Zizania palustris]